MSVRSYWWAFGFLSALFVIGALQQFGINAGSHQSGFAVIVIIWLYTAFNAVKHS